MTSLLKSFYFEWQKWKQTFRISISNALIYRLDLLFMFLGPSLVFFFVKYNLWTSIYHSHSEAAIQGYSLQQMIEYQFWVLIIAISGQGYNGLDIAYNIRLGRISNYLLRPFSFWKFQTCDFLGFQTIQIAISLFSLFIIINLNFFETQWLWILKGFTFTILVSVFWFVIQFFIGMLAFWMEETWIFRALFGIVCQFLAGSIFPLEIFPEAFTKVLNYTPFPYLVYIPARLFMGEYHDFWTAFFILLLWLIPLILISKLLWKIGFKTYSASGI